MLNSNEKMTSSKYILIFALVSFISGCASVPETTPDLELGMARIEMQTPSRFALRIKDPLYGKISKLVSAAGKTVFLDDNFSDNSAATRFIDVVPGEYKLSAQCEQYKSHLRASPTIWMANLPVSVQSGQTIVLACERYASKAEEIEETEETEWSSYDYLLDKHNYRVRLIILKSKDS